MAREERSSRRTDLRLRGVEVTYIDGGQPVEKLDLVIVVDKQEPIRRKSVAGTGTIACNILCPISSTLTIGIRKTWKTLSRMQRVHVETVLALASIDTLLQDEGSTINVKLSFSGILRTDEEEDARRRQNADAAKVIADERPVILDKLEKVRFLVDIIEPIGEAVSDLHPGIKGAFVAVGLLIKVCERQEACRDAALSLTDEWDNFLKLTERAPILWKREESRRAVERLLALIDEVSDYIINHTPTSASGGLFSRKYNKKIEDFKRNLAEATNSLNLGIGVEQLKGIDNLENNETLEKLEPVGKAHYKPEEIYMCLKDTRVKLFGKASVWLRPAETSPSEATPQVFWLCGMGGSGKSYVANSVAALVDADTGLDLSCFFCKRDDPELSKPENFFRTLAFNIAQYYASYQSALVALLSNPSKRAAIANGGLKTHFQMLFGDLLADIQVPGRSHVIVVDALDECGTPADQGELAECILSLAKTAPWIKIFVSSRPVEEIRRCFSRDNMCMAVDIKDEADTDADIRRFIEAELDTLKTAQKMRSPLSSKQIDQLVRQAAGLFIWASTLFKYVRKSTSPGPELRSFLSKAVPKEPLKQLYKLYEKVLEVAVNSDSRYDVTKLHAILGIVLISAGNRPLSVEALSCFLRVDQRFEYEDGASVGNMTRALHAVLYEDASMLGAVRVHHPSFLEFLELKLKDGFSLGIQDTHRLMFRGCLAVMNAGLKFNICNLEDSTLFNKDVPGLSDRISNSISEAVHYSSLLWFSHLSESDLKHDEEAKSSVSELLCTRKFLFWLEALSLLGDVGRGAAILRGCVQFFEGSPEIADVASDLERFVSSSSEVMQSAPHIYLSALTWVPEETLTQRKIAALFQNVHWITRKGTNWEATSWVKGVGEGVYLVACSPDGRFVAAVVDDCTVRILDSGTGEPVGEPLRCGRWIKSLTFSPDGERITILSRTITTWIIKTGAMDGGDPFADICGRVSPLAISPDGSLLAGRFYPDTVVGFWNARTGAAVGEPLKGHTKQVLSAAFSPDGQHVVTGSKDKSIRIWDLKTRTAVGNPLEGHEDEIYSVSYSPDGRSIASRSNDGTVRIWSAQTGAALLEPLQGLSGGATSLSFSPDGQRVAWVASGSANATIRISDTMTGMAVGVPLQGHSGRVRSVAFSPGGRYIASGSCDGTVRFWDVGLSATAGDASEGHSNSVRSVSFSPDGKRIASGSEDGTVRIWDMKTGAAVGGAFEGHKHAVNSVCFSPDGSLVVSASDDKTIRFWDAVTGATIGEPLVGHTDPVDSIAFSPDGQRLVSSSDDKTIYIWDVKTGTAVGNPIQGHESWVISISYSPDGRCIVSGSRDNTVRIWSAETGAALSEPLRGHSGNVRTVAFSPDGRWIASGSYDGTVRIWNAHTGAAVGRPLRCHSDVNSVAFSPDSHRIVSGSDNGIRIWDVEARAEITEPIHILSVYAVAFSPDGRHFASGSTDQSVRIWDARTTPVRDDGPSTDAHWNTCCARMDIKDGWVKDGEKLLLWIPHRYRENFKYPRLQRCIRRGARWPVKPEVDLEKLLAYTGNGWTGFYEE